MWTEKALLGVAREPAILLFTGKTHLSTSLYQPYAYFQYGSRHNILWLICRAGSMWCMSIYTVPDRAVASYYFVNHRQVGFYDVTVTSSGSVPVLHRPTFMWSRSAPFLAAARWVRIIGCSGCSLATLLSVLLRITVCCHCSVLLFLFFSRPRSEGWPHTWTYFLHLSLSSVILIDSSMESPVHVLVLSTQAMRDLPRLLARAFAGFWLGDQCPLAAWGEDNFITSPPPPFRKLLFLHFFAF